MSTEKSNKIGVVQLTILTMVNMMGSGIIMLPTKLAEIGTISIVSWLVTAVGSTALAYAFAQCGMFSKKSGGMGGYAEYSFGKAGNFMANYTYGVSLVIANTAIAISAVVTNVIPYLLSMAALMVLLKMENVAEHKTKVTVAVAFIGSLYSLYALYAAGELAMLYGSIVTFIGWTLYGFVSYKFDMKK